MIASNKQLKKFYREKVLEMGGSAKPVCPHFGECGGCALQHLAYSDQVQIKTEAIRHIFEDSGVPELEGSEVNPATEQFGYRTRMDYVTAFDPIFPPNQRMGLRKPKKFNLVEDLGECHIMNPQVFAQTRNIYKYALELGFELYDLVKHTGNLRYLVVRSTPDCRMVSIVTKLDEHSDQVEKLAEFALSNGFNSVHWLHNSSQTDTSYTDSIRYWGLEYLEVSLSRISNYKLYLGPNNFFQSNLEVFQDILEFVLEHIGSESQDKTLLDLYAGVGTIGISLSDRFRNVVGFELVESSVELANYNAAQNNLQNVNYQVADLSQFAVSQVDVRGDTVAFVDPPRTGMGQKGVEELIQLNPETIVYISCNPITQREDLESGLLDHYTVITAKGFDMFPQTLHMEHVVILKRK